MQIKFHRFSNSANFLISFDIFKKDRNQCSESRLNVRRHLFSESWGSLVKSWLLKQRIISFLKYCFDTDILEKSISGKVKTQFTKQIYKTDRRNVHKLITTTKGSFDKNPSFNKQSRGLIECSEATMPESTRPSQSCNCLKFVTVTVTHI